MEPIWMLIVGFAAGLAVSLARSFRNAGRGAVGKRISERDENLEKLKKHLQGREAITNDEVEELLGVSHATAERYLEELESGGVIEQVGDVGRGVYYRPRK